MLRWLTAGESHGPSLIALLDGVPAGLELTTDDLRAALARRRLGHGRGARQKFEQDVVRIVSGVRHGRTLGAPLAVEIANSEWPKWEKVMAGDPVPREDLVVDAGTGDEREIARNRPLTRPRPGHADLAGMLKYGLEEARPVLERASARETAARVAAGRIAAALLEQAAGIRLVSHTLAVGPVRVPEDAPLPGPGDVAALDADPLRCFHAETSAAMVAEVDACQREGDTLGGVVEVLAHGVPVGLGSHTQWDRRLDGRLAQAVMSIQAMKGVEIGDGFATAARRGSHAHDEIVPGERGGPERLSNRAGGLEGGMSNGQTIRVRGALKPISTVPRALRTIDVATGEAATANHQRSDVCAVAPAAVIAEAVVALTLADALLEKSGGDSVEEIRAHLERTAALQEVRGPVAAEARPAPPAAGPGPAAILIGPMGAGKTSVGRCLARRLGTGFVDLDAEIIARAGRPIPRIFAEDGEETFRALEAEVLAELLRTHAGVLALGGGAPLAPGSRERLRGHRVVLLEIDETTARRRLRGGRGRPLLAGEDPLESWRRIRARREGIYREMAALRIDGGAGSADAVAARIAALLTENHPEETA